MLKFVYVLNLQLKEEKAMSKKMQSNILLLITAFIWGSAFVAQKSGMDYIEPFTFNGIRTVSYTHLDVYKRQGIDNDRKRI